MFKKIVPSIILASTLLMPMSAFIDGDFSYDEVLIMLDSIATKHNEVQEITIAYLFSDEALKTPEFIYALLYFETSGWNSYIIPLSDQKETLIIFFSPQVAMVRSLNQSLLATLFQE